MLTLYYSPGACAMAPHIALEEAEADYALVKVDLRKREQKTPEYLAINPAGATPALMTDKGVITENVAILTYVAQLYPPAELADLDDPFAFAQTQRVNVYLASSLHPAISKVMFSHPPLEGQAREDAAALALTRYDLVERHLLRGPWVAGETFTVSDGYLSVFSRWARQAGLLDKARYPRLNAHLDLVQSRDAVKRVLHQEGLEPV